jgi:hypothetical protein
MRMPKHQELVVVESARMSVPRMEDLQPSALRRPQHILLRRSLRRTKLKTMSRLGRSPTLTGLLTRHENLNENAHGHVQEGHQIIRCGGRSKLNRP